MRQREIVMPRPRLMLPNGGCYHAFSRIVDRQFVFGDVEKEFFVDTMRRLEAFLGVRVLSYCVMSNHFHLLVEVSPAEETERLTVDSLRERLPLLYRDACLSTLREELDLAVADAESATGTDTWLNELIARYQSRMGNLSIFLKELKWRFSRWYNSRNDRVGTLWEDRFHSVLVEGDEHALMTMGAYIELNPVRAGLVGDPKDYRWCSYAEAVAGRRRARENLARLHQRMRAWQGHGRTPVVWQDVAAAYRRHLFGAGERRLGHGHTGRGQRPGIDRSVVIEVVEKQGGIMPMHEILRSKVRYLTAGAVLGSAKFVDRVFESNRELFGERRKTGARPIRGGDWGGLMTLRDLREKISG